ncbi:MAG TPA: M1 family metallopeptidase [Bacteroidota bacterium]|nr:M1 family metallopeptidase [Bacteroidota bacterium]
MSGPRTPSMILLALLAGFVAFTRTANTRIAQAGRAYDVLRYDLALTLRPDQRGISGTNRITFVTTSASSQVRFDASSRTITVDSVTGPGGRIPFVHSGNELRLTFPETLPASDIRTVVIHYAAVSAFDGRYDSGGIYFNSDSGRLRVGTISEPNFAREWWPCNDRPSDKALVSLACTVPHGMTAVSNGRPRPVREEGQWSTYGWETLHPIATYLVFLGAADYTLAVDTMLTGDGRVLDLPRYIFPEDSANAAEDFRNIKTILRYFSATFGPWPFTGEKCAIAEVEGRLTMENQTVVAIEKEKITGDRQNENTLVHEIAHQWWGNLVTPSSWRHIWLAEAFATFSEALYIESRRGPETYAQYMDVLMDQPDGYYSGPVVGTDSAGFWDSFSPAVYYKGALTLHMLRRMTGDDVFFAALREYLDGPERRYGNASTSDFIAICERRHGSDLDWFFNQWLFTGREEPDRPALVYDWTQSESPGGIGLRLTVRQEQAGGRTYRLPFNVRVFAGGATETFPVIDSLRDQAFTRTLSARVDSVVLDPERNIFMSARRAGSE